MPNDSSTDYQPHLIALDFIQEFPESQPHYDKVLTEYRKTDDADLAPSRFIFEQGLEFLERYEASGELSTILKFVQFVNLKYGQFSEDNSTLEDAFINRIPDPHVDPELAGLLSPEASAALNKIWNWRSDPVRRNVVNQLCASFPQLQSLAAGHTYGRENDIIPSPFMVSVTSHLVKNVVTGSPDKMEETKQILAHLENQHGQNENVDFLIESSFLGMFPYTYEPGYNIVELLGPKLEAAYRKQWNIPADKPLTNN